MTSAVCPGLRKIQDRTFSGTVTLVSLCPSMDLLAAVLHGNSVAIFRLSWQRLATIPVCAAAEETITTMAWSPSGAHLAIGTSKGMFNIHSVDRAASAPPSRTRRAARDTDPVATLSLPVASSAIVWSHTPNQSMTYADRSTQLFDSRPPAVAEGGILFVGAIDGSVTILSSSLVFIIARVQLFPHSFTVCHLHVASDQRHCIAIGSENLQSENKKTENAVHSVTTITNYSHSLHERQSQLRLLQISFLLDYWPEIERTSLEAVVLKGHLSSIGSSIDQLEQSWTKGVREVLTNGIAVPMEKEMSEFTQTNNIWDELYDIFCGSKVKGAVLHFLAQNIGENGAKGFLRSFRAYEDDAEAAIVSVLPLVQNLLSRASEYRGLSRLISRFAPIGVLEEDVEELFDAAEALFIEICDLSREAEAMSSETEAFLSWLVVAAMKASGESAQTRISGQSQGQSDKELELAGKFFEKVSAISAMGEESVSTNAVVVMLSDKIRPVLKRLDLACQSVFGKPCGTISNGVQSLGGISLKVDSRIVPIEKIWYVYDMPPSQSIQSEIVALATLDNGDVVWTRCRPYTQKWAYGRIRMHVDGLKIQGVALKTEFFMIAAVSGYPGSEKHDAAYNVEIHNLKDYGAWKSEYSSVCKDEVTPVYLNHVVELKKTINTKTVYGTKEEAKNIILNTNCARDVIR